MKKKFKGFYLFVLPIVIAVLQLSIAFAKNATNKSLYIMLPGDTITTVSNVSTLSTSNFKTLYDSLDLKLKGLSQQAFNSANDGFNKLMKEGKLLNDSIITIADFSLPSSKKRLFIIDLKNYKVLFNTLVAHGRNTGREAATSFSNDHSTYKSSPGFYITGETYQGKNGYSLKLEGVEKGINNNAYERGIVIHGADYVSDDFVKMQGYIGRSQGCPAVPANVNRPIINTIKNGACLFIYHPSYINKSSILN